MSSNEFEKSKVFSFNASIEYSDGGIVSKTVLKKQTGNISLFSFAKGEALSEHTAPFDAMIQVVDGQGEITIGGTPHIVNTGGEHHHACKHSSCRQGGREFQDGTHNDKEQLISGITF